MFTDKLLERNLVPDFLIRIGIKGLLRQRLKEIQAADQAAFATSLAGFPLAVSTKSANDQHYEVPAGFFEKVLGPRMKYSCAFYEQDADSLAEAEERMLNLSCERALLADGQEILELGCGWGSLSLWMAEKYPRSKITALSNSASQRRFILETARAKGLSNIEVLTEDMNRFDTQARYDRIVSVEMFEHMRNIPLLFQRISSWLKPDGRLFVHIFTHRRFSYLFEDRDASDWMARHFFTGGMMPSRDLYRNFTEFLQIEEEWDVPGMHYARTADEWLKNMDANQESIRDLLGETYGKSAVTLWWVRWRIFFMACAELWGWKSGQEWQVNHYRFRKAAEP